MAKWHYIVALVFLGAELKTVAAQAIDGNSLLEACTAPPEVGLEAFCVGYILGAWEGMNWGDSKSGYQRVQNLRRMKSTRLFNTRWEPVLQQKFRIVR